MLLSSIETKSQKTAAASGTSGGGQFVWRKTIQEHGQELLRCPVIDNADENHRYVQCKSLCDLNVGDRVRFGDWTGTVLVHVTKGQAAIPFSVSEWAEFAKPEAVLFEFWFSNGMSDLFLFTENDPELEVLSIH